MPYFRQYAGTIGNNFMLIDDNARPQQARYYLVVEDYSEGRGLERMEWPAHSLDQIPVDHLWIVLADELLL